MTIGPAGSPFDPHSYAPPLQNPWDFLRSMILPWLIVGAPLGAAVLRLTLALSVDTMGEDYVRTGDLAIMRLDPRVRAAGKTVG